MSWGEDYWGYLLGWWGTKISLFKSLGLWTHVQSLSNYWKKYKIKKTLDLHWHVPETPIQDLPNPLTSFFFWFSFNYFIFLTSTLIIFSHSIWTIQQPALLCHQMSGDRKSHRTSSLSLIRTFSKEQLAMFYLLQAILVQFYTATIESILISAITIWFSTAC